jgi:hypothetical protein
MTRVSVFTKYLTPIGDIRCNPTYEFVQNADPNPGRCEFTVSRNDPKCTLKYLQFGNVVLVRRENTPDWVGVVVRRAWNYGSVDILCLEISHVLAKRNTPNREFNGTAGGLFTEFLNYTNATQFNEKPIAVGSVFVGGTTRQETGGDSALAHIQSVSQRSGNDFQITYAFDTNGKMYLVGNWYDRQGIITNQYLREGFNIEMTDGVLIEDARDLANWVDGFGDASTANTRASTTKYNESSIDAYGLNQRNETFDGNREEGTVEENTLSLLKQKLNPELSFDLTVVDLSSVVLGLGNVYELDLNTAGFNDDGTNGKQARVEVLAMEIDSQDGTCRLITQLYQPNEEQ